MTEIIDGEYYAEIIRELCEALEHTTELLVDTWADAMEGDPERQVAVADAREMLRLVGPRKPQENADG